MQKGLDLKVGGEGMKGFYDKIIPDAANKLGKQWGAKVGETRDCGKAKQRGTEQRRCVPNDHLGRRYSGSTERSGWTVHSGEI